MGLARMEWHFFQEFLKQPVTKQIRSWEGTAGMEALIVCGRGGELDVSKCNIQSRCGPSSQANWCAGEQSCAQCCSCQCPSAQVPLQQHPTSVSTCPAKLGYNCWAAVAITLKKGRLGFNAEIQLKDFKLRFLTKQWTLNYSAVYWIGMKGVLCTTRNAKFTGPERQRAPVRETGLYNLVVRSLPWKGETQAGL